MLVVLCCPLPIGLGLLTLSTPLKRHYVTMLSLKNFKIILMSHWLVVDRMASLSLPLHARITW